MATAGTIEVIATIDTSRYSKGALTIDRANQNVIKSSLAVDKQQNSLNRAIKKYGEDSDQAKLATLKLNDAQLNLADSQMNLASLTEKSGSRMTNALTTVGKVGFAALATAAVGATALIVKNIDGAIKRIDALVAFPRVLKSLGISGEEAEAATRKLSDSLQGLPTSLSQGTQGVQGFITAGLDVNRATDAFLAFNNAMLAAGVEAGTADQTMRQLNQALSRGRIDGAEWNSIAANIPTVLQALSNESGKTTAELRELYSQNPQGLIDEIIRLNKEGSGAMASLEEQARNATGGIGTAFANLDNSIQRAMENVVRNIGGGDLEAGQRRISDIINNFSKSFGDVLIRIGDGLAYAGQAVQVVIAWLQPLITYMQQNETVANVLKTTLMVIGGILTGVVLGAIILVVGAAALLTGAINVLVSVFTWLMETAIKVWQAVSNWAVLTWNLIKATWSAATGFFSGIYNSIISFFSQLPGRVGGFFSSAWNNARNTWSGVAGFFSGVASGVSNAFASIPGRISGFFSSAASSVRGIWQGIVSWFSSIDLSGAGRAMIQGLIDGIGSMVGRAKAKVDEVVSSIRDFFPFSPAKTGPFSGRGYTTYSGAALMDDFAKGMLGQSSNITRAANSAVGGAMSAFDTASSFNVVGGNKAFDGVQGGAGREYNIGTITIASEVDGERWLRRLNGNQEIVSNGLVPTQSYM